jgi:NADPH-dependent 2,4-dienoyl-CoA reductase/sulfur reductase-like enzyme
MSAALYLARRGHAVTLVEREDHLGGQFALAWQAPGKERMKDGLASMERALTSCGATIVLGKTVDSSVVQEFQPDFLVWATGAVQNIPEIVGLEDQYVLTAVEGLTGQKESAGSRILIIGAGRTGLEIAEQLREEGYQVVATKRTDPMGA